MRRLVLASLATLPVITFALGCAGFMPVEKGAPISIHDASLLETHVMQNNHPCTLVRLDHYCTISFQPAPDAGYGEESKGWLFVMIQAYSSESAEEPPVGYPHAALWNPSEEDVMLAHIRDNECVMESLDRKCILNIAPGDGPEMIGIVSIIVGPNEPGIPDPDRSTSVFFNWNGSGVTRAPDHK